MRKLVLFLLLAILQYKLPAQKFIYHNQATAGVIIANVHDFTERPADSSIYMALNGHGVSVFHLPTKTWKNYKNEFGNNYWLGNNNYTIKVGDNDTVFSQNSVRISVFNGQNWVAPPAGLAKGLISVDNNKNLWVLEDGSLPKLQKYYRGSLTTYTDADFPILKDMVAEQIYCGPNNQLFICHEKGLAVFDGTNLTNTYFKDSAVTKVYIDNEGDLWAAGNYWFAEQKNGVWRRYNTATEPNWPSNFGRNGAFTQVASGDMYITSGYRLYVINANGEVKKYDYTDTTTKIPGSVNYLNSLFTDSRNHVWMGMYQTGGVIEIIPDSVSKPDGVFLLKEVVKPQFTVYPNPTINNATLKINNLSGNFLIQVASVTGNLVYQTKSNNMPELVLPTNQWVKGAYIVSVITNNQVSYQSLIVE